MVSLNEEPLAGMVRDLLKFAIAHHRERGGSSEGLHLEFRENESQACIAFSDKLNSLCDKEVAAGWMQKFFEDHRKVCCKVNLCSREGPHYLISEANQQGVGVWDGWEQENWTPEICIEVIVFPTAINHTTFATLVELLGACFLLSPPIALQVSRSSPTHGTGKESFEFSGLSSNTEQGWRLEKLLEAAGCQENAVFRRSYSDRVVHCGVGALSESAVDCGDENDVLLVAMEDFLPLSLNANSIDFDKLRVNEIRDSELGSIVVNTQDGNQTVMLSPTLGLTSKLVKCAHKGKQILCLLHFETRNVDPIDQDAKTTALEGVCGLMVEAFASLSLAEETSEIKNLVIPSIANSICLSIDLHSAETGEREELLDILAGEDGMAPSCPEAHAFLVQTLSNECFSNNSERARDEFGTPASEPEVRFRQCDPDDVQRENVIESLQGFLRDFLRHASKGRIPTILLELTDTDPEILREAEEWLGDRAASRQRTLTLSHRRKNCVAYARFFKVVQIVLHLLVSNKISTKRDIFYLDGQLFQKQSQSDNMIELLARAVSVPRHVLHVVSYSRGLVYGALEWGDASGNVVSCRRAAIAMPSQAHSIKLFSTADAVFVLEKECIFRRLIDDDFVQKRFGGKAILITGCGFPDVQTRTLLNRFSREHPSTPVYGIADWDPHGVEIIATYMLGSQARSHEASRLACPNLRWLGIHFEDLSFYGVPRMHFLPLTGTDEKKLEAMKRREALQSSPFWRSQLENISECGFKVEIEAINAVQCDSADPLSFLSDTYIHDKLCRHSFFLAASPLASLSAAPTPPF